LSQPVALITGAVRGIGLATAKRFLEEGYAIAGLDLPQADFADFNALAKNHPGRVIAIEADVVSAQDWETALQKTLSAFGSIDVLFNNAGISGPSASVLQISEIDFDRIMAVNVRGVFLGLQIIGRYMSECRTGVIINTSSISGERGGGNVFAYTASKHAVNGMTKSAAVSLAKRNVRVVAVCPSPTGTEMMYAVERRIAPEDPASAREGLHSFIPMKRYCEPEEIANVVVFLASHEASFITGALIPVDGGTLAD
jgi:3alpha(or 20beta)-hydroxysteroid dehydrogenase